MAPPCNAAKLLWKVLIPVKLSKLSDAPIAPPLFAELPVKLLVPLKVATTLAAVLIAPPTECFAELLIKLLVPLKLSVTLYATDIQCCFS